MKVQEKLNIDNKLAGYLIDDKEYVPAVESDKRYAEILSFIENGGEILKDDSILLNLENTRIFQIKSKAQSLILSKYPLEKQSSAQLGLYGEVYLQEMKDYITNIIRISNEAELNGTALEDIDWNRLDSFEL